MNPAVDLDTSAFKLAEPEVVVLPVLHGNDLWVAASASAVHIGAPLLTADAAFENTPGLSLLR